MPNGCLTIQEVEVSVDSNVIGIQQSQRHGGVRCKYMYMYRSHVASIFLARPSCSASLPFASGSIILLPHLNFPVSWALAFARGRKTGTLRS